MNASLKSMVELWRRWNRSRKFRKALKDPNGWNRVGELIGQEIIERAERSRFYRLYTGPQLLPNENRRKP